MGKQITVNSYKDYEVKTGWRKLKPKKINRKKINRAKPDGFKRS